SLSNPVAFPAFNFFKRAIHRILCLISIFPTPETKPHAFHFRVAFFHGHLAETGHSSQPPPVERFVIDDN
ncbi:MAG: hypothetical protein ABI728_14590, partial [Betaproteobacteria bacterium]